MAVTVTMLKQAKAEDSISHHQAKSQSNNTARKPPAAKQLTIMSSPPADPKPTEVKQKDGEEPAPKPKAEDEKSKPVKQEDASSDDLKGSSPPLPSATQLSSSETKAEKDSLGALTFDKLGENDVVSALF